MDIRGSKRVWWADIVKKVSQVENSRTVPALQTADSLAWFGNRCWIKGNNDRWGGPLAMTFLAKADCHALVDEESIFDLFNPDGSMKPDARLKSRGIKFPGVD